MHPAEPRCCLAMAKRSIFASTRAARSGGASSSLKCAWSPKRESAKSSIDPDPPDKRKRPPRANREAPAFFGTWAAANSAYPNEELRSSVITMWGRS